MEILIPEGIGDRHVIKDFFTKIATSLEQAKFDDTILLLYRFYTYLSEVIFPHVGKGHRIVTDKKIYWDFSVSDAISLIDKNYSETKENDKVVSKYLKVDYNDVTLMNGSTLLEILQTGLNRAAQTENKELLSYYTLLDVMFKIFAGVTENKFLFFSEKDDKKVLDAYFKKIDEFTDSLDILRILSPLLTTRFQSVVSFFYKPLNQPIQYATTLYQAYVQKRNQ